MQIDRIDSSMLGAFCLVFFLFHRQKNGYPHALERNKKLSAWILEQNAAHVWEANKQATLPKWSEQPNRHIGQIHAFKDRIYVTQTDTSTTRAIICHSSHGAHTNRLFFYGPPPCAREYVRMHVLWLWVIPQSGGI